MASAPETPDGRAGAPVPVPLTRFVGRGAERAEGLAALAVCRLLTLTGPGGSGKTRLAVDIANHARPLFAGGVIWVELAALADPRALAEHLAAAVGVRDYGARPILDAIVEQLEGEPTLIVLDNCEHLVDAAGELADALLRACPPLSILATSRQALGVDGERTWPVPPLPLPPPGAALDAIAASEAVQLFVDRARAGSPGFTLSEANAPAVARICRRLDGLPLAIELAAARASVLPPDQIAERLESNFALLDSGGRKAARHRTLHDTIAWSVRLLSDRQQQLLSRLSVFVSGFSLQAVEQVCADPPIARADVLDLLTDLIDKSMVMREPHESEARYRLLETVRQFARERLAASGDEAATLARHAAWFADLAETIGPRLTGGAADLAHVEAVERELDQFHAASDWAAAGAETAPLAVRIGTALTWFWFCCGRFREGRRRLEAAVAAAPRLDPLTRGRACTALGTLAVWQGDFEAAAPLMTEAVELVTAGNRVDARAAAWIGRGTTHLGRGLTADAIADFDAAVAALGNDHRGILSAIAEYWRGLARRTCGDRQGARDSFHRSLAIGRALDHRSAIAHSAFALGRLELLEGRHGAARERLAESLRLFNGHRDQWGAFQVIGAFAELAATTGDGIRAVRLIAASETIRRQIGVQQLHNTAEFTALMAQVRALVPAERFEAAWIEGIGLPADAVLAEALNANAGDAPSAVGVRVTARTAPNEARRGVGDPESAVLTVRALGRLEVSCGGTPIDARAWASAKSRELLVWLLCHPEGGTKEQAALALWPDASAAQVRNNFHVTVHRLRKSLGHADWCLASGDRYRLHAPAGCDFDVAAFETGVRTALARPGRDDENDRLNAALARYQGDFAEGEPFGEWAEERRERLRQLFVDGLAALATRLAAAGRHQDAIAAYQQQIARDNLAEAAYRGLMISHIALGDRPAAKRVYDALVRVLRTELDTTPEPETARLARSLLKPATP